MSPRTLIVALFAGSLACGDDASGAGDPTTQGTGATTTSGASATTTGVDAGTGTTSTATTTSSTTTAATGTSGESTGGPNAGALEIYWIDTEGGAATLLVTPEGPLVLVDAGNPGDRDADRIAAVVEGELGRSAIDLCIVTHYHSDHVGGVPDLVERVDIDAFWDHGDSVEAGGGQGLELWQDYLAVSGGKRTVVVPGDSATVGGVEIVVVAAAGMVIDEPLDPANSDNSACAGATNMPEASDENAMSVGVVIRFGDFDMLDLGDLTWSYEDELACRMNRIGAIDLYQTTHHGLAISGAAQLVHGIAPTVAVMNNGAHKGGAPQTWDIVASSPAMPDLWQSHRALDTDDAHNSADDLVANLDEGDADQGFALHARVDADGTITVTNLRNGYSLDYASR